MLSRAAVATEGDGFSRPLPACERLCARARTEAAGLEGKGHNSTRPPLRRPRISSKVCKVCPNSRFVDRIEIEVGVSPFDHALVVKMSGVRDRSLSVLRCPPGDSGLGR
jgi:hypothetical protein